MKSVGVPGGNSAIQPLFGLPESNVVIGAHGAPEKRSDQQLSGGSNESTPANGAKLRWAVWRPSN